MWCSAIWVNNIDIGGMEAVTPEVSASKLIRVFDKVLLDDTGKFYS